MAERSEAHRAKRGPRAERGENLGSIWVFTENLWVAFRVFQPSKQVCNKLKNVPPPLSSQGSGPSGSGSSSTVKRPADVAGYNYGKEDPPEEPKKAKFKIALNQNHMYYNKWDDQSEWLVEEEPPKPIKLKGNMNLKFWLFSSKVSHLVIFAFFRPKKCSWKYRS